MSLTISKLLKGETLPDFNFGKAAYFFFLPHLAHSLRFETREEHKFCWSHLKENINKRFPLRQPDIFFDSRV